MTPAFKVFACVFLSIVWIGLGREQVRLGAFGWDVAGCFCLSIVFLLMAFQFARKL